MENQNNTREAMLETCEDLLFLEPAEQFDGCIVGVVERFNECFVAYDRAKVIQAYMSDGMSEEDAEEFFSFNVLGAWVGECTPCFIDTARMPGYLAAN